ncbi:hypothetical protein ASPBRDRAFT_195904 [Aspergillus brasiliensis CBS 101740]|uniref:Uncharacterized protein n=1 Tax=Aspergillus brasiliensis (strain CBS 101740 / IMI 381727 / IBT 21946) TaxID=767769 RepID=A0A1L9UJD5_ASPBC|nr:hypothetical protein ASPBRDRAFT_195904 [Aspergillus brasiliensis CBS 101740]
MTKGLPCPRTIPGTKRASCTRTADRVAGIAGNAALRIDGSPGSCPQSPIGRFVTIKPSLYVGNVQELPACMPNNNSKLSFLRYNLYSQPGVYKVSSTIMATRQATDSLDDYGPGTYVDTSFTPVPEEGKPLLKIFAAKTPGFTQDPALLDKIIFTSNFQRCLDKVIFVLYVPKPLYSLL